MDDFAHPLSVEEATSALANLLEDENHEFKNIEELWDAARKERDENGELVWYRKGKDYWSNVAPTVNGVLGGYSYISNIDVKGSQAFLAPLLKNQPKPWVTLDCGAGIGRVSQKLLTPIFDTTDLVELCPKFLDKARSKLDPAKVGILHLGGLQDFMPEVGRYTVVWVQWVAGHLCDDDLVAFLARAKDALKPGGYVVVKENVIVKGSFFIDREDSSVVRTEAEFMAVFGKAGLTVKKQQRQINFPKELFPVIMYALQ